MKKLNLLAVASVLCSSLQSQPFTGIDSYVHFSSNIILTDGSITNLNSNGFIMGGYDPLPSPGNPYNLYIDKTDPAGTFTTTNDFSWQYKFLADFTPCGPSLPNATNGYGMSIKEIPVNGTAWYIMAAAFNRGVLYSGLDNAGNPVGSAYFTFPPNANNPTKPLVTKALASNRYYISGSYMLNGLCHMYVLKVGIGGGIVWSYEYAGTGVSQLVPTSIMESPYAPISSPELVIVGKYTGNAAQGREGFFARLNGTTGAVVTFNTYGSTSASNEDFLSVSAALSSFNGSGYVIGGYSDNSAVGTAWMLKLKSNGNPNWSKIMTPTTGIFGQVTAVKERFSSAYNQYEYYGAATDNNALSVFKLDNSGSMFSMGTNNNNEFIYNSLGNGFPAAISYQDNGSVNDGIHVFGTSGPINGDYMMVRACFNGAAGNAACSPANITINTLTGNSTFLHTMSAVTLSQNSGLTSCTNFSFYGGNVPVSITAPCDETNLPTAPYAGNQSRTALATGIKTNSAPDKFSLSPNPVKDKLSISYAAGNGASVSVGLYNNLGQLVTPVLTPNATEGSNQLELDLNSLNINSGIYFVTLNIDGLTTTKKIVYTK